MSASLRTTNRQQKVLPRPGSQLSKTLTFSNKTIIPKKASVGQVGWLNKSRVSFSKVFAGRGKRHNILERTFFICHNWKN